MWTAPSSEQESSIGTTKRQASSSAFCSESARKHLTEWRKADTILDSGLPISLKEQIDIEGIEMSLGYVGRVGQVSKRNALLADILLEAGAVPFVRTNIPQGLVFAESMNNLFGKTLNPHNRALTSGGSSGGETALLAMKGSICGVGSDLGGSIRSPASFNGLYGLRPSSGRVPCTFNCPFHVWRGN